MRGLTIRDRTPKDAAPLATLMHKAVQHGAAGQYDQAQRDAWCKTPPSGAAWSDRLMDAETIVAERSGYLVGVMSLEAETGLIDLAYVDPDLRGSGVAGALYAVLEGRARCGGVDVLWAEASLLAERFFLRRGWRRVARQMVERDGVSIPNVRMKKHLTRQAACARS